jgi:NO-binding membrane sensor protein with MHYT domain
MRYLESILNVLVVGLVLGAGLPALFATGMLAYSFGAGGEEADHLIHKPNPVMKYLGILLFVFVALVIVTAVAWITRSTIDHHFGVDLFPMFPKK